MVRQFLVLAGLVVGATTFGASYEKVSTDQALSQLEFKKADPIHHDMIMARLFDGSSSQTSKRKAAGYRVSWKRPAGQFWGTGYSPENKGWYYVTPLLLRPWVEYTFENLSTDFNGTPEWALEVLANANTGEYQTITSNENTVTASYLQYEWVAAPRLSYKDQIPFPTQFEKEKETPAPWNEIQVLVNNNFQDTPSAWDMPNILVSSHYWGFTRMPSESGAIATFGGAPTYEGMKSCPWFGTNAGGWNAMATRFEKPDQPYLLNAVYWYYGTNGDIPNDIPLKAYVFKTANDAAESTLPSGAVQEVAELGELIAVSESFIPKYSGGEKDETVKFEFKEKNTVTGAEHAVSLEIEDDIIVIVTGYDVNLGNGNYITSFVSLDDIDEGHGNLGFLGKFEMSEEGVPAYNLVALNNFFDGAPIGNTTLGVLADVSYPWLVPYNRNQEKDILLPNEGETTDEVQGLEYYLYFMSTAETYDMEVTYNGEEECDWLSVFSTYDDTEVNEDGEEEFTGIAGLAFEAAPNPTDENRTCVVNISIPAASYQITFRQGSNNNAVEVVGVEANTEYFDLQGRRVANPEKGLYIKKVGNKAEKVIL
ncbi:MAG: hypothetical protein K2N48_09065 [Muribaculaceae bacterium]|nr:hypothetical protein [Muribaculaceae bacterium]